MKNFLVIAGLTLILLLSGCTQFEGSDEKFYESIPVIDAYYNGETIWFIHTDVTSPEMAERLTKMTGYRTLYVPKHNEAVDTGKIAKLYVFTNGVSQKDSKPWGGGPFNYQIDIFDSIPGDDKYTAIRNPHLVTWNENSEPRILKSAKELLEAEKAGELTIKKTPVVVNVPVVRWPSSYLGGTAKINNK